MSFYPNLQSLLEQAKMLNQNQQTIIALLQQQNQILTKIEQKK
jgi:hypothetical protein